jgi:hypothetical protein
MLRIAPVEMTEKRMRGITPVKMTGWSRSGLRIASLGMTSTPLEMTFFTALYRTI